MGSSISHQVIVLLKIDTLEIFLPFVCSLVSFNSMKLDQPITVSSSEYSF